MGGWGNIDFINGGSGFNAQAGFGGGGAGDGWGAEGQFNALFDPVGIADYFRRTQWQRDDKKEREALNRAQKERSWMMGKDQNAGLRQGAEREQLQASMAQSRAISRPAPLKMTSGGFNNAQHLEMNDMGMSGAQRQVFLPQQSQFTGPALSQMDSARSSLTYSPKVGEDKATVEKNAENDAAVLRSEGRQDAEQKRRTDESAARDQDKSRANNAEQQLRALQSEVQQLRAALAAATSGVR